MPTPFDHLPENHPRRRMFEQRAELEASPAYIQAQIVNATQQRLDDFAKTRFYDGIQSLSNYADDEDLVFNAEGTYGKQMRSRTWRVLYDILGAVQAGTRPMPAGYADIEAELPALVWPA